MCELWGDNEAYAQLGIAFGITYSRATAKFIVGVILKANACHNSFIYKPNDFIR